MSLFYSKNIVTSSCCYIFINNKCRAALLDENHHHTSLSDQTLIGGVPWKELKVRAMDKDHKK